MSRADIYAFVDSAYYNTLTPEGVTTALAKGIPLNARQRISGCTALHYAVYHKNRELVVALLDAGANANMQDNEGRTSVWEAAYRSTAEILQLLLDGGGNINQTTYDGETILIALLGSNDGDAAARLNVLLAWPKLNLDAKWRGRVAEHWALLKRRPGKAIVIAAERARRQRWSDLRSAWITGTVDATASATGTVPLATSSKRTCL